MTWPHTPGNTPLWFQAPEPPEKPGRFTDAVWDVLHNPKYTGYQVWNRRARKATNKMNAPEAWIWSEGQAHEPLVSKETFERAALIGMSHANAARPAGDAQPVPFVLRSFLRCGICGLRMQGHRRKSCLYYACEARRLPPAFLSEGHPRMVYLNEDIATEKVLEFLNTYIFGPDRLPLLAGLLDSADPEADRYKDEVGQLRRELRDLEVRVRRQVTNLEAEEPDSEAAKALRARLRELAEIKAKKEARLRAAERELAELPSPESAAALLSLLPVTPVDQSVLTEGDFRSLLEAMRLQATYNPDEGELTVEVVLTPEFSCPKTGKERARVLSVPPTGFEPVLSP